MKKISFFLLYFFFIKSGECQVYHTIDSLKSILKTQSEGEIFMRTSRLLAFEYIMIGDYKKADSISLIVKKKSDEKGMYYFYQIKGEIENGKTNGSQALGYFEKCRQIAAKYNDLEQLMTTYKNLTTAYRLLGDTHNQMKYALMEVELLEKNGSLKQDYMPYINIAVILSDANEYEKAMIYFKKAKLIAIKNNDFFGQAISENRMGNVYFFQKKYSEAYTHYKNGLDIANKHQIKRMQGILASNVGNIKMRLNQNNEAERYFKQAEKISREMKSTLNTRDVTNLLGELYQKIGKYKLAEKYYLETAELSNQVGNPEKKRKAIDHLASFYAEIHDYKKAFFYSQKAIVLKDSMLIVENFEKTQGLLAKYETEKKEAQIKLLNEESKSANFQRNAFLIGGILITLLAGLSFFSLSNRNKLRRFEEQQKLRNRIAADLHDEIGSTLSSISILSEMVAFQQQKGHSKPEIMQQISDDSRAVINKMDDIIWTINPENDTIQNLETRLKTFAIPLFESKDIDFKFRFSKDIENLKIDMGKRRDIYLILKEAINNLIKYSQCKNTLISIKNQGKNLKIIIKDDGVGFVTNPESERNGLRNMKMRAEKIGGDLKIKSEIGKGTEVSLELKL